MGFIEQEARSVTDFVANSDSARITLDKPRYTARVPRNANLSWERTADRASTSPREAIAWCATPDCRNEVTCNPTAHDVEDRIIADVAVLAMLDVKGDYW